MTRKHENDWINSVLLEDLDAREIEEIESGIGQFTAMIGGGYVEA